MRSWGICHSTAFCPQILWTIIQHEYGEQSICIIGWIDVTVLLTRIMVLITIMGLIMGLKGNWMDCTRASQDGGYTKSKDGVKNI